MRSGHQQQAMHSSTADAAHSAVVQGDQGVRRARYEARWHAFAAKDTPAAASEVAYGQVPCNTTLTTCLRTPATVALPEAYGDDATR